MFSTFTAIFEALTAIETELAAGISDSKREKLIETLLSLRRTMDKCVQYWLKFEERVNEIQERFSIALPDTLPPGFLEDIDLGGEVTAQKAKPEAAPAEPLNETKAEREGNEPDRGFYKSTSEITVNSFRRALGFEDVVRFEHHIVEAYKSIVRQPYNRRGDLLAVARSVPNISAKHEGGDPAVEETREHPSDILDYFRAKEEVISSGAMPLLERNYLDKHDAVNETARALTREGLAFIGARKLHPR